MKTWFQWMTSPVLAVCLFLAALVSTTAAFADMPAISAYDADTTYVISGNALTESQSTIQPVLLFGQIAGLVAAKSGVRATTDFLSDVTVKSRGKVVGQGTVDLRGTLGEIESGQLAPRDIFKNREGLAAMMAPCSVNAYGK